MNVGRVGQFIRDQRRGSRLSLSKLSGLAGVSIPYLSQVERGLRKPSADILQAIAKALRISSETLYVQAGILEDRRVPDVAAAVMADETISDRHKRTLLQIYQAFREEFGESSSDGGASPRGSGEGVVPPRAKPGKRPARQRAAKKPSASKRGRRRKSDG